MSDKAPFVLIIAEGPHDVNAISRILTFKGFKELHKDDSVPAGLSRLIPRQYPTGKDRRLIRIVPHPTFMERNGTYLTISNADGETRLGENLSNLIGTLSNETLGGLLGIGVVADMDYSSINDRQKDILRQIEKAVEPRPVINMKSLREGELVLLEKHFPLYLYFLPNNRDQGTLETILLAGAEQRYSDLHEWAINFINLAKTHYLQTLTNYNDLKATVGVIANVLRPGKANQVSIGLDEWFTEESISHIPSHIALSDFLDSLCELFSANETVTKG